MTPHERLARALREAADAVEELGGTRQKPRRHRGPVRVDHGPIDETTRAQARVHLRRAGLVKVG